MTLAVNIFFGLGYGKIDPKIDPKIFERVEMRVFLCTYVMGNFLRASNNKQKKSNMTPAVGIRN